MEYLANKYGRNVISLGVNCFPSKFIRNSGFNDDNVTKLFDYVGTSMYGIIKLVDEGFDYLIDTNNYELVYYPHKKMYLVTNTKLTFIYVHGFSMQSEKTINQKNIELMKTQIINYNENKQIKRIEHMKNALNSEKIMFIRIEGASHYRNPNNPTISDYDYSIVLSDTLKKKYPSLDFLIVLICKLPTSYNSEHNVLTLKIYEHAVVWDNCEKALSDLFKKNEGFIKKHA